MLNYFHENNYFVRHVENFTYDRLELVEHVEDFVNVFIFVQISLHIKFDSVEDFFLHSTDDKECFSIVLNCVKSKVQL